MRFNGISLVKLLTTLILINGCQCNQLGGVDKIFPIIENFKKIATIDKIKNTQSKITIYLTYPK